MSRILSFLFALLLCGVSFAQTGKKMPSKPLQAISKPANGSPTEDRQPLFLTARFQADSVVLRWAPGNAPSWRAAIATGYVVEKAIIENGVPRYQIIAETKALDKEALVALYQSNPTRSSALALATLYNETAVKPETLNFNQMKTKAESFQLVFGYNLLSADLDPSVATWSGLRLVDRGVKKGQQLGYRVSFRKPIYGKSDTAYVLVDTRFPDTLPEPPAMKAFETGSAVKLEWTFAPQQFSAWWIEKSKPGNEAFFPLHQNPYTYSDEAYQGPMLRSSFSDTGLKAYEMWEYRLVGITAFGERVEGKQRLLAQAKDVTPPAVPEWETIQNLGINTRLNWSFSGNSADLNGFIVLKSEQAAAGFVPVSAPLSPSTRTWTDTVAPPSTGVYYQIMAFDTAGNSVSSASQLVFGKDSVAPEIPEWISGVADTNGIVRLSWRASASSDLQGYRLYRAYAADHAFALVTPRAMVDTFFQDTLMKKSLTTKVFYRLTTVDLSDNVSDLGPLLFVKRPDLVAPEPPVIVNIKTVGDAIQLSILPSQSEDVKLHRIERKLNESNWEVIPMMEISGHEVVNFLDSTFSAHASITYRLVAVDSTGNESDYSRLATIKAPLRKKDFFNKFTVKWLSENSKVLVEWECKRREDNGFVALIRQVGDQLPRTIQNLKEETMKYEDSGLSSGQKVKYWLRYAGAQSEYFSEPQEVMIP